jgi:hypothetical protein
MKRLAPIFVLAADAGDGAATWDRAAATFQAAVSKADWSAAFMQARQPLGAVTSRTPVSSEYKRCPARRTASMS